MLGFGDVISSSNCPSSGWLFGDSCALPRAQCGQWVYLSESVNTTELHPCQQNLLWFPSPVQQSLWITVCLMGMEIALGKYVTIMCSDFKEEDTRLYCPVTTGFTQLSSVTAGCLRNQTIGKSASENMRTRPVGLKELSIMLFFSDVDFMFL